MEALIAVVIVAAWTAGRWRERRRWVRQRTEACRVVDQAIAARRDSRHAFDVQMAVIRQQREMLTELVAATDTVWERNDHAAWTQLATASRRARTELL